MNCAHIVVRILLLALLIAVETCVPDDVQQPPEPRAASRFEDTAAARSQRSPGREALRHLVSALDEQQTEDHLEVEEIQAVIRAARMTIRNLPAPR